MLVQCTQFVRPDGHQVPRTMTIADDCRVNYEAMESCGGRLTAESLTTGEVSLCIEHQECGDFDCRVVKNGPSVPDAVESMLRNWLRSDFEAFIEEVLA